MMGMKQPITFLMALLCLSGSAMAKQTDWMKIVGTQSIAATMLLNKQNKAVKGRVSFSLKASESGFDDGKISVDAFNVMVFGVSQSALTGIKPENKDVAALGFVIDQTKEGQFLQYDPYANVLRGKLSGRIGFPQLSEFADYSKQQVEDDNFISPTQSAVLSVIIALKERMDLKAAQDDALQLNGVMDLTLDAQQSDQPRIISYQVEVPRASVTIDYSIAWFLEPARLLCLQPVRMYTFTPWPYFGLSFTGDGLAFGLPGAKTQWKKADIVFNVRDWVSVYGPSYFTFSSSEASAVRALYDADDCIEIFFADRFSPQAMWGGGATFGAGLHTSQIITSDENADFGIDFTHLAHELGHVLTLMHPGLGFPNPSAPYLIDGTSGTLMCPSGFANDNPQVNSTDNKSNANNPLLTFTLKAISAGPDCNNNADCGPCP
jgi:hypothetical protein